MLSKAIHSTLQWTCWPGLPAAVGVSYRVLLRHWKHQLTSQAFATAARPSSDAAKGKDRSRQLSALVRYGRDLTEEARRDLLDPVIGRQDVIQRAMQVLLRRAKHNPLLIGEAGVGKTAVVEGIAQLMAAPNPPRGLAGKRLVALDVGAVVAGSTYRGEFEERLQSLLHDCEAAQGSVVLFIDEIHVLVGAGNVEGGLDFANMLKPALARSQLQVIGATTLDEYRQHIETDPALSRRFQPILVEEPSAQECLQLLQGLAPRYEAFHGVSLPHATLATAVAAAQRYVPERRLPDSAIDLIDEAAAKVRLAAAFTGNSPNTTSNPSSSSKPSSTSSSGTKSSSGSHTNLSSSSKAAGESQGSSTEEQIQQHSRSDLASRQEGFPQEWEQQSSATSPPHSSSSTSRVLDTPGTGSTAQQQLQPTTNLPQPSSAPQEQQGPPGPIPLGAAAPGNTAQTWSDWITAKGWRGEAEVQRQQLLEWFGASPQKPLKGSAGHQQTTSERRKKHEQLFGRGATTPANAAISGTRPDFFTGSTNTQPHTPSAATATTTAAGSAAGSAAGAGAPGSASAQAPSAGNTQQPLAAMGLPSLGSVGPIDYSAKPCPHCGTVVLPADCLDPVRLQCGHCGFRFLNVAPEKLQLGTTVLLDKQQQQIPWGHVPTEMQHQQQQQQQQQPLQQQPWGLGNQPSHHITLSDTPAAVAAAAAVGGASATASASPPHKRTAVAVQERHNRHQQQDRPEPTLPPPSQHTQQQQQPQRSGEVLPPAPHPAGPSALSAAAAAVAWSGGLIRSALGAAGGGQAAGGAAASRPAVSPQDVLQVVAEATGIPQHLLTGLPAAASGSPAAGALGTRQPLTNSATHTALQELAAIQAALSAAVQGQAAAVAAIIGALRLSRMGLAPHQHAQQQGQLQPSAGSARPALSLVFQGPSGVGKTTMAKTLAETLLPGEPQGVLVFSCGELSERHSISRLVGAPPGYVGYGKGGLLTEAIRRRPYSCVVFDDVERAHPDVVGLLLQAVEDGYLMDSLGHTINLRSTVILFTANTNRPAVAAASHTRGAAAAAAAPAGASGVQQPPQGPPLQHTSSFAGAASFSTLAGRAWSSGGSLSAGTSELEELEKGSSSSSSSSSSRSVCGQTSSGGSNSSRGFHNLGGSGSEGAELEPDDPPQTDPPLAGQLTNASKLAAAASPSSTGSNGGSSSSSGGQAGGPGSVRDAMIAELGARVDDVIHFQPLNGMSMRAIVHQQLQQAVQLAAQQGVLLQVEPSAAAWLAAAGCSDKQGARPLLQLIRRHVLAPLAAAVMDSVSDGSDAAQHIPTTDGGGQQPVDNGAVTTAASAAAAVEQGNSFWAVATLSMPAGPVGANASPQLQLQRV